MPAALRAAKPLVAIVLGYPKRAPSRAHLELVYLTFIGGAAFEAAAAAAADAAHVFDAARRQHAIDLADWRRRQRRYGAKLEEHIEAFVLRHPSNPLVRAAVEAPPASRAEERAQRHWRRSAYVRNRRLEQIDLFGPVHPQQARMALAALAADSPMSALARHVYELSVDEPPPSSARECNMVDLAVALVYGSNAASHIWFGNPRSALFKDMRALLMAPRPAVLRRAARVALRSVALRVDGHATHCLPLDLWKTADSQSPTILARLAICTALECLVLRAPTTPIVKHLAARADVDVPSVDHAVLAAAAEPPAYPPPHTPLAPSPPAGRPAVRARAILHEPIARVLDFVAKRASGARFGSAELARIMASKSAAPARTETPVLRAMDPTIAPFQASSDNDLTPEQVRANLLWHLQKQLASVAKGPHKRCVRVNMAEYVAGGMLRMPMTAKPPACSAAGLPSRLPPDLQVALDDSESVEKRIQAAHDHYQSILSAALPAMVQ